MKLDLNSQRYQPLIILNSDSPEFAKIPSYNKNFSLFHVNTRSLSKNFDQFQNVLSTSKTLFDVTGKSETKQKIDKDFIVNVNIDAYNMYTQPSKSSSAGVAVYVKKKLDHLRRAELCILDDDFESVWIEIKNKKGKNFLCGCFYRHPNTDTSGFVEHIESIFTQN